MPPEDLVRFSAMTGQSLYYLGESDLAHKVLAIAEEEGAERAAYALKLLQSEGELSISSTGKDNTFVAAIAAGRIAVIDLTAAPYQRCADLIGTYTDLGLSLVDSSLIAAAEQHDQTQIATLT